MSKPKPVTRLAQAIMSLEDAAEAEAFLRELLTPCELHDIVLRWQLMEHLAAGGTQRAIAEKLGISLCKITRGARLLKSRKSVVARLVREAQ